MRFIFLFLFIHLFSCNNSSEDKNRTAEVNSDPEHKNYGEMVQTASAINVSEMLEELEIKDSLLITVKGEITSTCKKKGCWMNVKLPNGDEMRVTFKDYGFFVPKEGVEGKTAVFEGYVTQTVVDEETRRHFAKDAGKSEEEINSIVGDEEKLTFVADGVVIYN
ncbi:MAG: DUF4920 domain-containing protein [Candidatus Cyclobacteriaceae bacterium M2_1C_046]